VVADILGAMNTNGLDAEVQKDVLSVLYSLKEQIIRV